MSSLLPILAAVFQASSFVIDKVALSARGVTYKTYAGISFPLVFLVNLIIFLVFRPSFSWNLVWGSGLLLLVSISISIGKNLYFYRALKDDRLSGIETLDLLHYIPIIIVSSIIFTSGRNFYVIIPALVASLATVWSHWEHHRIHIARHTFPFLLFSFISAPVGAIVSKLLLETFHPVSFELIRSAGLAIPLGMLFFKDAQKAPAQAVPYLLLTNVLTTVGWILFFFSYQRLGIVYTTLLFSIQPLLVYFASLLFLKEKVNRKHIIAFFIVLISIAAAQFYS